MRIYRKIKRIIEWIPVLWRTEDFDHAYATEIWAYSLERLRNCMLAGYGLVTPTKLRKINTAINLLKRMSRDHKYTDAHLDYLIKKYGPLGIPGIDPVTWTKPQIKELVELNKFEHEMFIQDVRLLSKILERHLPEWWD